MAYYCEECLEEVSLEEKSESEIMFGYHILCIKCQKKLKRKRSEIKLS